MGETTWPEIVRFTDAGCIWVEEISAWVAVRQGVDTDVACVIVVVVFVVSVVVAVCSVE
jgi:hypothetical protein